MKAFGNYSGSMPTGIKIIEEGEVVRLFFDYEEVERTATAEGEEPDGAGQYMCENVDVMGGRSYGGVVSAIVRSRYDSDAVQAILANKALSDDKASDITAEKRTEYKADYDTFQQWRARAKEVAAEVTRRIKVS